MGRENGSFWNESNSAGLTYSLQEGNMLSSETEVVVFRNTYLISYLC